MPPPHTIAMEALFHICRKESKVDDQLGRSADLLWKQPCWSGGWWAVPCGMKAKLTWSQPEISGNKLHPEQEKLPMSANVDDVTSWSNTEGQVGGGRCMLVCVCVG